MNRRELLEWTRPLAIIVALPAHAQTTINETCNETDCTAVGDPLAIPLGRQE